MSIKISNDKKGKTQKKKSFISNKEKKRLWDIYDIDNNEDFKFLAVNGASPMSTNHWIDG